MTTAHLKAPKTYFTFTPTLGFYLGKHFLLNTFLVTMVLSTFILLIDAMELLRRLGKADTEITATETLQLLLLKAPDLMLQMAPFAVLIGTMLCFSRLSQRHELIAIRTSGVSARQFLVVPLLTCLAIGSFNLSVLSPFSATTLKSYEKTLADLFPGSAQGLVTEGGQVWLKQTEATTETMIYAAEIHDKGHRLEDATIFKFADTGQFLERLDVGTMTLEPGRWHMANVQHIKDGEISEPLTESYLPTTLTVEMISGSFTSPHTLSVFELPQFIALLKETGFPTLQHELQWHKLLAMPALMLVMFLLGAPFALHFSRNTGTGTLMVMGLCMGFAFFLFSNFIGAYGLSGRLTPAVAAWIPTAIAALVAFALFVHFREEG